MFEFMLSTEYPLATDSRDFQHPLGSTRNNINPKMVQRLHEMCPQSSVLDMGCAGGGFVRELIESGFLAIGIDGTDHPLQKGSTSDWQSNVEHYFTCDITKPFKVYTPSRDPYTFDVVTMFEVWEHILERHLHDVLDNINKHTHEDSICIFSASNDSSVSEGVELHITRQNKDWWTECFGQRGWIPSILQDEFVEPDDWGGWIGSSTMHFVLQKDPKWKT